MSSLPPNTELTLFPCRQRLLHGPSVTVLAEQADVEVGLGLFHLGILRPDGDRSIERLSGLADEVVEWQFRRAGQVGRTVAHLSLMTEFLQHASAVKPRLEMLGGEGQDSVECGYR